MPSPHSKKWDKNKTPRGEPSNRFYDVVISGTIGMFLGIVVTIWILLA